MTTILYCILSALASWFFTWLYYQFTETPHAIEKHWIGHTVQERWHYEDSHDYISKN